MEEFKVEKVTLNSLWTGKGEEGPLTSEALYLRELNDQIKEMRGEIKELRALLEEAPRGAPQAQQAKPLVAETASTEKASASMEKVKVEEMQSAEVKEDKKKELLKNVLYCMMIVAIIGGALMMKSAMGGKPFSFAGFSAFTVLTSSMEDVIPKDSLVITKSVDPNTLQIGDDITYMSGPTSTITHRIIGIEENFAGTGARGFETKGTMNAEPDKDIVPAANVVGKVIFHNKFIGTIATYIKGNWPYVLFVLLVVIILMFVLSRINEDDDSEVNDKKIKKKKERGKNGDKEKENDHRRGRDGCSAPAGRDIRMAEHQPDRAQRSI